MGDYNFSAIDHNLSAGDYSSVIRELSKSRTDIYGSKDAVLAYLDFGLVNHFAENYGKSNENLSEAELLIEKYYATSITQSLTSFLANDNVKDYSGEDFEDIYTNIFMALNYLAVDNQEDAMVEIRRFDNKLKNLRIRYNQEIQNFNKQSEETKVTPADVRFNDSALARYLSMIMYRSQGDVDNARVDKLYLEDDFNSQPSLYDFKRPSSVDGELEIPAGYGRLNVLVFTGLSPVKEEEAFRFYSPGGIWYKLALPKMVKRYSKITGQVLTVESKLTGEKQTVDLEKIESIENIACDTFQRKLSMIKARAIARSIVRSLTTAAFDSSAKDSDSPLVSLILYLFGAATKASTEMIERADVRSCRYFPATASVAGINLLPGDYEVTVKYMSGSTVLRSESKALSVRERALNFVESSCLQ